MDTRIPSPARSHRRSTTATTSAATARRVSQATFNDPSPDPTRNTTTTTTTTTTATTSPTPSSSNFFPGNTLPPLSTSASSPFGHAAVGYPVALELEEDEGDDGTHTIPGGGNDTSFSSSPTTTTADDATWSHHADLNMDESAKAKSRWKMATRMTVATARFSKPTRLQRVAQKARMLDAKLKSGRKLNEFSGSSISWTCSLFVAVMILSLVIISSLQFMVTRPYVLSEGKVDGTEIRITESSEEGTEWPAMAAFGVQCCTGSRTWTADTGRHVCDMSGYVDVNMVQRMMNRSTEMESQTFASKKEIMPVNVCTLDPNITNVDPYEYSLCSNNNTIAMRGDFESNIFEMFEIDLSLCNNNTMQVNSPEANAAVASGDRSAGYIKSFHPTDCAPPEDIVTFMEGSDLRCYLVENNKQVDTSVYFNDERRYWATPSEIKIKNVMRVARYNYLRNVLKKVDVFHVVQNYQLESAMISNPDLEVEFTDINWDVSMSSEGLSNQVKPDNFLRIYMRMAEMQRVIRIEPEMNASNLLEGIGGMAEYLMLCLYFLPLSVIWCWYTAKDCCKKKRVSPSVARADADDANDIEMGSLKKA